MSTESASPEPSGHIYLSTACFHGLHDQCRADCKFCAARCACSLCDHSVVLTGESYQIGATVEFHEPRSGKWVEVTVVRHDEYGRPMVLAPGHSTPYSPDPVRLRRIT